MLLHFRGVINIRNEKVIKAFGKNLRALRKNKKLSIEELAYDANLEYSQVARIERGEINTTISTAYALADALDIALTSLFDFELPAKKS